MPWFWRKKEQKEEALTNRLSWDNICRLRQIAYDMSDSLAKGQRQNGALPSEMLEQSTRGEIRGALIERLMQILESDAPKQLQAKAIDATAQIFITMQVFDIKQAGGTREMESQDIYMESLALWDKFQELVIKDNGRRFEVDEGEIREKVVVKLIEQSKNP